MGTLKKTLPHVVKSSSGQSIIEVIIATLIVGVVLTAIASGLTLSIKNTAQTQLRELSTNFAQEGLEVFRRERSMLGWTSFAEALDNNDYCLNTLPQDSAEFATMPTGECSTGTAIAGTTLTRNATVTVLSADSIQVHVTVEWQEAERTNTVEVYQVFQRQ
jgi:type II secretory pathway pseudopilin PulG